MNSRAPYRATFGDLESLEHVFVYANPLTGPLPLSLADLEELVTLNYEDTKLCVPVDDSFRTWLESLDSHKGTEVDCNDRYFLELFYHATGGPNWRNNTNWLTDAPIGAWYGVTVDSTGRVIELELDMNNLIGTIPLQLESLDRLAILDLDGNELTGAIPAELGNLANLTRLDLYENELTGAIPAELGNLANLTRSIPSRERTDGGNSSGTWKPRQPDGSIPSTGTN